MDSIKVNVKLPKQSEISNSLKTTLNSVQKNAYIKLNLNIDSFKTSVTEVNQLLGKLKAQMSNLGGAENLFVASGMKEANDQIERQNRLLKEQQMIREGVIKTSSTTGLNKDGEDVLIRDLERVRDEYGQIIEMVTRYNRETGEITDILTTTTNDVEKQQRAYEKLEQSVNKVKDALQNKLNQSMSNQSFTGINDKVFRDFQLRIKDLDTDTAVEEIRKLQREINNLGNSDSQIIRLQSAISRHEATIKSLKERYENLIPENELAVATSRLNELVRTLEKIQSGDTFTNKSISNMLNDATASMRELGNATRNTSNHFSEIVKRIGLFDLAYDGVNKLQDVFREGVQSVIDMNTAVSDLAKVVDLSDSQLAKMTDTAVELGESLGRSSVDVMESFGQFGRAFKDTEEIAELSRSAIIGANTMGGGITSQQVADGLVTIMSSLKIEASEAMDIINSLNEVQNNYTISSMDLLEGLKEVGSVANTAGLSLDELNGIMTAIQQSTGKTGDSIGVSINSILSRMYGTGRGGMEDAGKAQKALESVGVAVRDQNNEFRNAGDIFADLNNVWGELSQTQRIYVAQQVASTTQFNEMMALMENYETAIKATETSINSLNSAEKENEVYMNSIVGRMNSLKASTEGFFLDFISSDMIKGVVSALQGLVDGLTWLQNTFGSLGMTVGILSTAFMSFTNNPLRQFADDIVKHKTTLGGLSETLQKVKTVVTETGSGMNIAQKAGAGLKAGFEAVGNSAMFAQVKVVALQTALSFGLGLVITGVISALTGLVDWIIKTDEETEELNENLTTSVTETAKTVAEAEKLYEQKRQLDAQISNTSDAEQRVELEKELLEIEKQMASVLPSTTSGFNSQGEAISSNNGLIEEQIRLKKEQMEIDALEFLQSNKNIKAEMKGYQNRIKEMKNMKIAMAQGIEYEREYTYNERGQSEDRVQKIDITPEMLSKYNEENLKTVELIAQAKVHIDALRDAGYSNSMIKSLTGIDPVDLEEQEKAIEEVTEAINENTDAKNKNNDVQLSAINVEDATKNYAKAVGNMDEVYNLLNSINEEQAITPQILQELSEKYPELGGRITELSSVQEFLNNKIKEQETIANQAYQEMVVYDEDFYDNKFLKNEEWMNNFRQSLVDMGMASDEAYNVDLSQFNNLQELKSYAMDELGQGVADWLSQYIDISADGYDIDFANFRDANQAKVAVLQALNEEIKKVSRNVINQSLVVAGVGNMKHSSNPFVKRANDEFNESINRYKELSGAIEEVENKLPDFSTFNRGFGFSAPTSSHGLGSGGSSKAKKESERQIKNLTDTVSLYYQTENAIQKLNNAIDQNNTLMENSKDEERIKYLRQEINLINQKKVALDNNRKVMNQELADIRRHLDLRNFSFGADGQITNYAQRLGFLEQWANSATGDEKQSRQDSVKDTVQLIERYTELLLKEIPAVTNEIQELGNEVYATNEEIKEIYKEKLDNMADIEGQISDLITKEAEERIEAEKKVLEESMEADRKRLESKKKALQDEMDLYNDTYDEENRDAELNEQRNKLLEIQNEIDQLQFATDKKSQTRLIELTREYEEQQKAINDMIRENQHEATNDRFEQEMELIDQELESRENDYDKSIEILDEKLESYLSPENLTGLVSNAISSGMINVMGQTQDLNDAMLNMLMETEVGIANLNTQYDEWHNSLTTIIDDYGQLYSLMNSADIKNPVNPSDIPKIGNPISINFEGLTINGPVTEDLLPKVENLLNQHEQKVYKTINQKLGGRL